MSAEVPSSSRPRKIEGDSVCRVLGKEATEFDHQIELVNEPSSYTLSLQLEVHFMSCWLIFKLPKGPIYDFF